MNTIFDELIEDIRADYTSRTLLARINGILGTFVLGMTMGIGISVGMAIAG